MTNDEMITDELQQNPTMWQKLREWWRGDSQPQNRAASDSPGALGASCSADAGIGCSAGSDG